MFENNKPTIEAHVCQIRLLHTSLCVNHPPYYRILIGWNVMHHNVDNVIYLNLKIKFKLKENYSVNFLS